MNARRATVAALSLLLIGWLIWRWSALPPTRFAEANGARKLAEAAPSHRGSASQHTLTPSRSSALADRSTLADALNSPATDIQADLRLLLELVDTFRTNFPADGNPTGTNAEITATLTGRNRLQLALIPPDHPAINQDGELCDRWGTPFFFHAESATRMEIRSAGPDRKLWSDDDVVLSP